MVLKKSLRLMRQSASYNFYPRVSHRTLESRVLLDAAGATELLDQIEVSTKAILEGSKEGVDIAGMFAQYVPVADREIKEIVFIDSAVKDISGVLEEIGEEERIIISLDSKEDGLNQMTGILSGFEKDQITGIHILSHGASGMIKLGGSSLDIDGLDRHKDQFKIWDRALSKEADILLYGCDIAQGEAGKEFVEAFKRVTDADISASTDKTGSFVLGGNDVFEYDTGLIETEAFDLQAYSGLLADAPTLTLTDTVSGNEDTAIGLTISVTTDGSHTASARIENVPDGAVFSAGTPQPNGDILLTQGELAGLTVTPASNDADDFTLTVIGIATHNGDATVAESAPQTISVNVVSQPDAFNIENLNEIIDIRTTAALYDDLENALRISEPTNLTILGTTIDAGFEATEPSVSGAGDTVHILFTPKTSQVIQTETINLGVNHRYRIAEMIDENGPVAFSNFNTLNTAVTSNFRNFEAGTTYLFTIDGSGGSTGNFQFNIATFEKTYNDDFADREMIDAVENIDVLGFFDDDPEPGTGLATAGATDEDGEGSVSSNKNTVWYEWRSPVAGQFTFDLNNSPDESRMKIYTQDGGSFNDLTVIGGSGELKTQNVEAGKSYFLQVDDNQDDGGNYRLEIRSNINDFNDNFPGLNLGDGYEYDDISIPLSSATNETGEPGQSNGIDSIWHHYTPRESGNVTIASTDFSANDRIEVHTGNSVDNLTTIQQAADTVTFAAVAGTTYYISVDGDSNTQNDTSITLTHSAVASQATNNDDFSNAFIIGAQAFTTHFDNTGFTAEAGETAGNGTQNTGWYKYIAPMDGVVEFSTDGSAIDTVMDIFTGPDLANLTLEVSDDDSGTGTASFARVKVTKDQELWIALDGKAGAVGQINLESIIHNSSQDDFADAINIGAARYATLTENILGTDFGNRFTSLEVGEDPVALFGQVADKTVWYKWAPNTNGIVTIDTTGSNFDTVLGAFTSATGQINDLVAVDFIEDNRATNATDEVKFAVQSGTIYYLAVGGEGDETGEYKLNLELIEAVRNNHFVDAYDLGTLPEIALDGLNIAADNEADEPLISDLSTANHSVWYEWKPAATGAYKINITSTGAPFDPVVAVFDDVATIDLLAAPIATDDDSGTGTNSEVIFTAVAGQTYKIMVSGKTAQETGNFDLELVKVTDATEQAFFPISIRNNVIDAQDTNHIIFSGLPAGSQLLASDLETVRSADAGGGDVSIDADHAANSFLQLPDALENTTVNFTAFGRSTADGGSIDGAAINYSLVIGHYAAGAKLVADDISLIENTGESGNFNITLLDTDGSEVIDLIQVKNVPASYSFSTGTDNGGGVYTFSDLTELNNLVITASDKDVDESLLLEVTIRETANADTIVSSKIFDVQVAQELIEVTAPAAIIVSEDVSENLSGVVISYTNPLTLTLSVANGVLISNDASVTAGSGTSTLTMVGTGDVLSAAIASGQVTYQSNANFSGADTLTIDAADGIAVPVNDISAITITPVADAPTLSVSDAAGGSGEDIPLDIEASLTDASETLSIAISGVPDGASLSAGIVNPNGTVILTEAELENLTINANGSSDFDLTVTVTSEETNGDVATVTETITVDLPSPPAADNGSINEPADPVSEPDTAPIGDGDTIDTDSNTDLSQDNLSIIDGQNDTLIRVDIPLDVVAPSEKEGNIEESVEQKPVEGNIIYGGRDNDVLIVKPNIKDMFAGPGDDKAIFDVTENIIADSPVHLLDGGEGFDTLEIRLTSDQIQQENIREALIKIQEFIAKEKQLGEETLFVEILQLELQNWEDIKIIIDGVEQAEEMLSLILDDEEILADSEEDDASFNDLIEGEQGVVMGEAFPGAVSLRGQMQAKERVITSKQLAF